METGFFSYKKVFSARKINMKNRHYRFPPVCAVNKNV